ncbi:hypothetical protein [Haloarcula sp. CBA1122]|uniref:hypothetical protein n=1 Tax=Haloarcula sp. CBA1122 TaxID=2668069 RepID=UPI00130C805B|nr:hypothetical protein [Haloarcula sp. CBA1122]MUV49743.1 hypothetical protein [Haloarcula sp. CBA1122]
MSSNSVGVHTLVEAVGEDPRLKPFEKETQIGWTKDGFPTVAATQFDQHVAHVFSEEAGISRRLIQHPHFTVTGIRVNDSVGEGRSIEPDNFCGGKVTAVGGYIPIVAVILGTSVRSTSGHANVVPYTGAESNGSELSPDRFSDNPSVAVGQAQTSDGSAEVGQPATTSHNDSNSVSTTDPLDW